MTRKCKTAEKKMYLKITDHLIFLESKALFPLGSLPSYITQKVVWTSFTFFLISGFDATDIADHFESDD